MRVLLADDHALMRAGMRAFLQTQPDVEIVGEAGNGNEAVAMAAQLQPDVIVMDITMPEKNGIDATREIRTAHPQINIVMVTSSDDPEHVFAALASGATGYCIKDIDDERLLAGLKAVSLGDVWMDVGVAKTLARSVTAGGFSKNTADGGGNGGTNGGTSNGRQSTDYTLTAREIEVLRFLADGLSNQEIAAKLFISKDTVKSIVTHILQKMQVSGRTEAAAKALRNKII